jgi:hypothetical protein
VRSTSIEGLARHQTLPRLARGPLGAAFAVGTLLLVIAAFVLNNLGPYLGINYAGAMTMYSGLSGGGENHLVMSKILPLGMRTYVSVVHADAAGDRGSPAVKLFRDLATSKGERRPLVHQNVVRYQASRACSAAPNVRLELRLRTEDGQTIDLKNVCAEPSWLRYDVVSSYPPCREILCRNVFEDWQQRLMATN